MLFQACHYLGKYFKLEFLGNIEIPLFFLLSGFSLSLGYGQTIWSKEKVFPAVTFYRRRLAR